MSKQLEWTKTYESSVNEYQAICDGHGYIISKRPGESFSAQAWVNVGEETQFHSPVLAPTLEDARQLAEQWELEQELWPTQVPEDRN
jgi:hypothetical protein